MQPSLNGRRSQSLVKKFVLSAVEHFLILALLLFIFYFARSAHTDSVLVRTDIMSWFF